MTDRELLELAAKAAGIEGEWNERITGHGIAVRGRLGPVWNPLHDDGDALRLAVKLRIQITYSGAARAEHFETVCAFDWNSEVTQKHGDDPNAATRLAIVRAAAKIGRAKP